MRKLEHLPVGETLPSPKGVALAILELCNSEDASYHELARVAQVDPALAGRLIRQANSARSISRRPSASVTEAITRLGLTAVRNLALGFSLIDDYRDGPCKSFAYEGFWSHSLLMALAMQYLAASGDTGSADELFACGLLARIGFLGLATAYPDEYAALLEAGDEASLAERERARLHTDHNELTAALLMAWGIPAALAEPVYHHEDPERAGFSLGSRQLKLAQLFHLARRIADLGLAPDDERSRHTSELLLLGSKIGLDAKQLGHAIDELVRQWREWGELLNVPASALPAFEHMAAAYAQANAPTLSSLRVLLASSDERTGRWLTDELGGQRGYTLSRAVDGHQALAVTVELQPQIVIADHALPGLDGIALCQALRETEWGRSLYLMVLFDQAGEEPASAAFEAGADSTLNKPLTPRAIEARLKAAQRHVRLLEAWEHDRCQLKRFAAELATSNRQLSHAAMTDTLTGLPNRRSGMDFLASAWSTAVRSAQPLSVLILDLDYFKEINDSYGHATGDKALRAIAQALLQSARKNEHIARVGGEEFLMICQNSDARVALQAAERLRKMVASLELAIDGALIRPTLSIGVATRERDMTEAHSLVRQADRALYRAKQIGRNRVCVAEGDELRCGQG